MGKQMWIFGYRSISARIPNKRQLKECCEVFKGNQLFYENLVKFERAIIVQCLYFLGLHPRKIYNHFISDTFHLSINPWQYNLEKDIEYGVMIL